MSNSRKFPAGKRPRVILLADGTRPAICERVADLRPVLERYMDVVSVSEELSLPIATGDADFAVVFGGDGSILRAARLMGRGQLPVIGVNLGRLGFLADLQPENLDKVLPCVVGGDYRVVEHLMFECRVLRDGEESKCVLGLNEAAVLAGPPFAMLEVQLYVDGELATTYSCDGLIVSTPVGSTAHSLSAGGPILRKSLQAFVILPISPHTLTNRPVVDAADRIYELAAPTPHEGTSLVVDGRVVCQITAADRIRVERSQASFQLVEVEGRGYYRTLREKLGWSGRLHLND